jgi:hypothetical protein
MEFTVVISLLALLGVWAIVAIWLSTRRMHRVAARLGAELGWPVSVRGIGVSVAGRLDDTVVRGRLRYEGKGMLLELELDARGAAAPAEVDRGRVRDIFSRLRGFGVGGGTLHTSVDYPLADGQLRERLADFVYLARASQVLDGDALMACDPRTSAVGRHIAAGMPAEQAIAEVLVHREDP